MKAGDVVTDDIGRNLTITSIVGDLVTLKDDTGDTHTIWDRDIGCCDTGFVINIDDIHP